MEYLTALRFVLTINNLPATGRSGAGQGRKALSRLGTLLHYWFVNARRLFHLLIALAFMFLTLMGAAQTYSAWEDYHNIPGEGLRYFSMFGGFTVFLAILCLYSFVRARSVR